MSEWISVKDRLPEEFVDVLAYLKNGKINRTWRDKVGFRNATSKKVRWYSDGSVTHWMPLPEPPEVEYANT